MNQAELFSVEWAENPLTSKIHLTDVGRLRVKVGIAIDWVYGAKASIQLARDHNDLTWLRHVDPETDDVDAAMEANLARCEADLRDVHCGDCTCVPASCMRCHAESLLGFSTTEGLGKHEGHCIQSAFSEGRTTIDEALSYLASPVRPTWGTPEDWAPHMERWALERANALEWLSAYRDRLTKA